MKNFTTFIMPFISGIFPALLLTLPIGSVYAFSLFSADMATMLNCSFKEVQFAFSLSIFFLGMGAAFGGTLVEKNIRCSAIVAAFLFSSGLICTSIGLYLKQLWLIYLGYGGLCGIAQGIGYLTPVKTLLMWFPKHKGLASAISIVSFGLGSSLCTLIHSFIYADVGILNVFFVLAAIYFPMMICGGLLIKKPYKESETSQTAQEFKYSELIKDKFFIRSWLFMFINISAGLALIGSSVNIFKELNGSAALITMLMMLAGIFNGGFRLIFAWISDHIRFRVYTWEIISMISAILMLAATVSPITLFGVVVLINATYGGGFSTLPGILSDKYDITCLSRVHGAVLSAWGIAGLIGNNISTCVLSLTESFLYVPFILLLMYWLNIQISSKLRKQVIDEYKNDNSLKSQKM